MNNDEKLKLQAYTDQRLKDHIQNNKDFQNKLIAFERHKKKLLANSGEISETLSKEFSLGLRSQIFNGYYIIQEFLSQDGSKFYEEFINQSLGHLAIEVPLLVNNIINDQQVLITEMYKKFMTNCIDQFEDVFTTLQHIAYEAAYIGSLQAITDLRSNPKDNQIISSMGLLGQLDDVYFITPSYYLAVSNFNNSAEFWYLFDWTDGTAKIGTINILKTVIDTKTKFSVHVVLTEHVIIDFKEVAAIILTKLKDLHNTSKDDVTFNFGRVESFYILE